MGAQPAPQILGRYGIYGKIAAGGMASVHFGRLLGAAGFSRTVAVKRLHPHLAEDTDFLSTMIDEARLAARINHPNVVPTLDVVATDGELLLVMEYVRGESLARLMRSESARGRPVPLPIASAIVIGALHGLHAAHEAKSDHGTPLQIVHRDVSPQNILVGVDGLARVIDFGVAKAVGRVQTTSEGILKGKIAYMAPEQLAEGDVARAVDVYGMGVVLWEILTGSRLFAGENAVVFGQVIAGVKDPPSQIAPHVPPALDALVMKALARDPRDRFASAKEMAERLLRVAPPAFPTDVGTWVEEAAQAALAQREATLSEIERRSDALDPLESVDSSKRIHSRREIARQENAGDTVTTASQPSSLAVATPGVSVSALHRRRWTGAVATAALVAFCLAALLWRSVRVSSSAPASAVVQATDPTAAAASPATVATEVPTSDISTTIELSDLPTTSAAASASGRSSQHPGSAAPHSVKPRTAACDPPYSFDANGIKRYKRECN